jgi:hypothetical protein
MATPQDCPMIGLGDKHVIAEGFELGLRRVIADDELFRDASRKLYEHLSGHTLDGTRRWVGSKLLALLGSALFGLGLYLIVRFGGSK